MIFQSPTPRRADLRLALAVSVFLHLGLLWQWPPSAARMAPAPLVAHLRGVPSSVAAPQAEQRPARKPLPSVARTAAAAGIPVADMTPHWTPPGPSRSEAPGERAGSRDAAVAATPTQAFSAGEVDGDGIRQYRFALAREAGRYKRYPRRAVEGGATGTAEIRVSVAAGGWAEEVQLARSSGDAALDDVALDMIRRAAPHAVVPEALRSRAFAVNLPVVFELAGE